MMVPWRTVKYIKEWPWFSTLFFILELFFNIQNKTKILVLKCTENLYSNIFCVCLNHYSTKWLRLTMRRIKWHVFLIFICSFQEKSSTLLIYLHSQRWHASYFVPVTVKPSWRLRIRFEPEGREESLVVTDVTLCTEYRVEAVDI